VTCRTTWNKTFISNRIIVRRIGPTFVAKKLIYAEKPAVNFLKPAIIPKKCSLGVGLYRAPWSLVLSAGVPECQKIKNGASMARNTLKYNHLTPLRSKGWTAFHV